MPCKNTVTLKPHLSVFSETGWRKQSILIPSSLFLSLSLRRIVLRKIYQDFRFSWVLSRDLLYAHICWVPYFNFDLQVPLKGRGKGIPYALTEHHAMKANWGSRGIAPLILWPRHYIEVSWSFTARPLYPQWRSPGTHWIGGWVGPRAFLDALQTKYTVHIKRKQSCHSFKCFRQHGGARRKYKLIILWFSHLFIYNFYQYKLRL
jgi:hypothetical protein